MDKVEFVVAKKEWEKFVEFAVEHDWCWSGNRLDIRKFNPTQTLYYTGGDLVVTLIEESFISWRNAQKTLTRLDNGTPCVVSEPGVPRFADFVQWLERPIIRVDAEDLALLLRTGGMADV